MVKEKTKIFYYEFITKKVDRDYTHLFLYERKDEGGSLEICVEASLSIDASFFRRKSRQMAAIVKCIDDYIGSDERGEKLPAHYKRPSYKVYHLKPVEMTKK